MRGRASAQAPVLEWEPVQGPVWALARALAQAPVLEWGLAQAWEPAQVRA